MAPLLVGTGYGMQVNGIKRTGRIGYEKLDKAHSLIQQLPHSPTSLPKCIRKELYRSSEDMRLETWPKQRVLAVAT